MHELSLAQNIMEIVWSNVPLGSEGLVRSVRIRVGEVSGVVPESLAFCFSAIAQGTSLTQATLEIEVTPFTLRCKGCTSTFSSGMGIVVCPSCGSRETEVLSGLDLQVVAIDIEDEQPQ